MVALGFAALGAGAVVVYRLTAAEPAANCRAGAAPYTRLELLFGLVQWGIWNAVWSVPGNDTSACRAVRGLGACWAVIPEKLRFILFGTYTYDQQWRPALATLVFIALFYLSSRRSLWRRELALVWAGALILIYPYVKTQVGLAAVVIVMVLVMHRAFAEARSASAAMR